MEADEMLAGRGKLWETLKRISETLDALGIDYALIGGLALFLHGRQRLTEDVDLLVERHSLDKIHDALVGKGYLPAFAGSRNLRDTITGIPVEFVTSGEYPGDGKPKPIAFPLPNADSVEQEGIKVVSLRKFVELKLASGMTAAHRLQDLADVLAVIQIKPLDESFAQQLNPYVREKYLELCRAAKNKDHPGD